jgi:hypothetical protein
VAEKKIEFVDGGMSQHDMGCTTFDSMFSNFMVGHQFIVQHFGEEVRPRVGWSLDPFGISSSNAIFYAMAGFDARCLVFRQEFVLEAAVGIPRLLA